MEHVLQNARARGSITANELMRHYPRLEECVPQVDELFARLFDEGIEVILDGSDGSTPPAETTGKGTLPPETATTEPDPDEEEPLDESKTRVDLDDISAEDTVSLYLKQMGQVPLLSGAQEVELARQIEDALKARSRLHSPSISSEERATLLDIIAAGEQARIQVVEANTRLVVSVAKKYIGQGVPFLDLIQEGNIGLMKAVEKFDYHRGYKFSTYATWWIRQGITRALAQQSRLIRLPVHAGDQIRKIYRTAENLEQESGRRPTPEEIGEETGLNPTKVDRLLRISRYPISLARPVGDDGDTEFGDFIEDEESLPPTDVAYQQLLRETVESVLRALTPREARILRLRFGLTDGRSHTLEEVGVKFGLTRERIRQIEHQALDRLRHPLRCNQLRDYLR